MKTIEEEAKQYADKTYDIYAMLYSEDDLNANKENLIKDFKAGVEFAQRWIPIEEELPPVNRTVLIEYDDAIVGVLKYKKYIGFTSYRSDLSKITHWRPINLK